jgi:hypothetical protein
MNRHHNRLSVKPDDPLLVLPESLIGIENKRNLTLTNDELLAFRQGDIDRAVGVVRGDAAAILGSVVDKIAEAISYSSRRLSYVENRQYGSLYILGTMQARMLKGFIFEGWILALVRNNPAFKTEILKWVLDVDGPGISAMIKDEYEAFLTGSKETEWVVPSEYSPGGPSDLTFITSNHYDELVPLYCPITKRPASIQIKAVRSKAIRNPHSTTITKAVLGYIQKGRFQRANNVYRPIRMGVKYRFVLSLLSSHKKEPVWKECHQELSTMCSNGDISTSDRDDAIRRIRGPEHFGLSQNEFDDYALLIEEIFSNPSSNYDYFRRSLFVATERHLELRRKSLLRWNRTTFSAYSLSKKAQYVYPDLNLISPNAEL